MRFVLFCFVFLMLKVLEHNFVVLGRFVMSSSEDNKVIVYSVRGDLLKVIEPKLNILYESLVSPCGRFVAASGFTPDVFVFEVTLGDILLLLKLN